MPESVLRTQVGIVGAGPAGLLLSHLLHLEGIDSIILETHSRQYVEQRIRAGVLEQGTTDLLIACGAGERLRREGLEHRGIELRFRRRSHRIDLFDLTGGRAITVYGQHEVVKDLIHLRLAAGGQILFEAPAAGLSGLDGTAPRIRFTLANEPGEIHCDFIAGCDGFHGICRSAIPETGIRVFERDYPYAWLGILVAAPPASHELIYCRHDDGFALMSMRTPQLSRLYLQCRPGEDPRNWPDDRIWPELQKRFETDAGFRVNEGPILQKSVTAMRSYVVEPIQYGALFLAGDAAHIVPPTGAKGMNLAVADVRLLAQALSAWYRNNDAAPLNRYSTHCLRRVWRAQHFSWWMTSLLHRSGDDGGFEAHRQLAELDQLTTSRAAAATLAENYTGLPFD